MNPALLSVPTRFRAYQLGNPGSSFSYFSNTHFTLLEGRASELSRTNLLAELGACGKQAIDTLHITSWDKDHCTPSELAWILEHLRPQHVEYPGYAPHTDAGRESLALLKRHMSANARVAKPVTLQEVNPVYIKGLNNATSRTYADIFYHPKFIDANNANNNSTVKLFRSGMFNVASLGDVESPEIGSMLRRCNIFSNEVDVLILAHHGADNGLTTKHFLEEVRPTLAICSSDYDNQYEHPKQEIKDALYEVAIPLYTTKTGDVLIESLPHHRAEYRLTNFKTNTTAISSSREFRSKKVHLLNQNADTLRNRLKPGFKGLKRPR
jgi:competence protein ComEC